MKSTVVIFSGQMRTFTACAPLFKWQVLRHYPNADIFISTTRDDQTAQSIAHAHQLFSGHRLFIGIADAQPFIAEPQSVNCTPPPFSNSVSHASILRQWWQHKQAWSLYESAKLPPHHTIIRTRPDSFFHDFTPPSAGTLPLTAHTPWWGRFGGCNDRFAVMGYDAARAYFGVGDSIDALIASGCPFHPETAMRAALERAGVTIHDNMHASFSTLRIDGTIRPPEVSSDDIARISLHLLNRRHAYP